MARKYMKIAMVGQKRVPSHDGGIEVVVGELAKRMVAQGHSVTCYNRTDKQQPQPENFNGISLKYVPTIQKKGWRRFPQVSSAACARRWAIMTWCMCTRKGRRCSAGCRS